ncbi:hypothetical protein SDC9_196371 [bioreactor metagenome]|uniref:Uncharacterized protein n=1 Tax=bioreactor metagenome TaxID=1076179 RepID=A0A645IE86_9ZZZZ
MPEHKHVAAAGSCGDIGPGELRDRKQLDLFLGQKVLDRHFGMVGMRDIKRVVKTAQQRVIGVQRAALKHAESFLSQHLFVESVQQMKPRLCRPADI